MKLSNKSPEEINKILGDAWLNVIVDERTLFNPLTNIPPAASDNPHLYYTWLMMQPEYFSFICDEILGVKIFPFQAVILAEMWKRKFPMLVMNRGGGKALRPDELIKVKQGWKKLSDIKIGERVYASDGKLYSVIGKTDLLKDLNFYKITFNDGRTIECCEDHLWKVYRNESEFFDDQEVLTTKEILESNYQFYFPINKTLLFENIDKYKDFEILERKRLAFDSKEKADEVTDLYRMYGFFVKQYFKFGKYFVFIKHKRYIYIKKWEYIGKQDGMCISVNSPDKTYIIRDYIVTHNTFMLALYSLLRMLLLPGRKIVVAGAGFRQSKMVWEYCCQIWNNSAIFRNAVDNKDGPKGGTDSTYFNIGESKATFVPVGLGETIRGLRCLSKDTFIQTEKGLMIISDYIKNPCSLINEFGELEKPSKIHKTPLTDVYEIKVKYGMTFRCSEIHKVKTVDGWKLAKDLTPQDRLIIDENEYFPSEMVYYNDELLDRNYAAALGMRVSNKQIEEIPKEIFLSPKNIIKSFFMGLFSGDAISYKKNHSDRYFKCFVRLPNKVLQQMQFLLFKFKIAAKIDPVHLMLIRGKDLEKVFIEFKPKNSEVYYDKFFTSINNRNVKDYKRSSSVEYVKKLDKKEVLYDFTMPKTHSFIGNSFVQHNSNDTLADEFKCLDKNTLILTDRGIERISDCFNDDIQLINIQNGLEKPSERIKTPPTDVYHIVCEYGFDFKCSNKHKVLTTNGWKLGKDLTTDDSLVFKNYYKCRKTKVKKDNRYYRAGRILIDELDIPKDLSESGMNSYDKIPSFVLLGTKSCLYQFLEGITVNSIQIGITTKIFFKYKQLADEVQFILRCLNIIAKKEQVKNGWELSYSQKGKADSIKVESVTLLPEKDELYDFTLPVTHTFIGNGFVQHNSHNQDVFESVISGFGSVSSSPQQKVSEQAKKDLSLYLGIDVEVEDSNFVPNQIVISGTAYYYFNHFAQYWNRWKKIIESKGDEKKLLEVFPNGIEDGFDWRDYSVIRMPYQLLPKGYLDSANIARSRATLNKNLFQQEFEAIFTKDSDGFFKASEIEACVANNKNSIIKKDGRILFIPRLSGEINKKYYMGIDTASQVDNFAVVILEIHNDHRRVVYCWSTNNEDYKQLKADGKTQDTSFLKHCNTNVRKMLKRFNIERISIDSQGGGRTFYESLHDKSYIEPGDDMIWEVIEPGKLKDSDGEEGRHIVELVNFAQAQYTTDANHGLKKDIESKNILFPDNNPSIYASFEGLNGIYTTEIEECIENIEELKTELTTIVITETIGGRQRFDTPEVKTSGLTKGRLKKDRYSALLMANMSARTDFHVINDYTNSSIVEMVEKSKNVETPGYVGPAWIAKKLESVYD